MENHEKLVISVTGFIVVNCLHDFITEIYVTCSEIRQ